MKRKIIVSLLLISLFLFSLFGCNEQKDNPAKIKEGNSIVVLLGGQSNASGYSEISELSQTNPEEYNAVLNGLSNCYITRISEGLGTSIPNNFYQMGFKGGVSDNFFGPEIGIALELSEKYPDKNIYIIKAAWGGSSLHREWFDSNGNKGTYYNGALNFTKTMLDKLISNPGVEIDKFVYCWMQGETDSGTDYDLYQENTIKLIDYLRDDLKDYYSKEISFIDAYISTLPNGNGGTFWPHATQINQAKQAAADTKSNCYCIKTNGEDETAIELTTKAYDLAHYTAPSMIKLGREFGKVIENIN